MKKTSIILSTAMALSLMLGITACAEDYPTADKPIKIRMASFVTEEDSLSEILTFAGEKLEELSGGAIECDVYYNGTVLGFGDMYTGVSEGTADVGLVGMAVLDSSTKLNQIFSALHKGLPEDDEIINECYWEAIDKIPAISEELAEDNLIRVGFQSFAGSETLFCSKKSISGIDDFKGLIIQSSQSLPGQLFTSLGASTVAMEISDFYNSLDRGVTDAVYDSWAAFYAQKLMEIGTDYFKFGNGGISAGIINVMMNKKTFDKLSPEQQDMVYEAFQYGVTESLKDYDANQEIAMKTAADNAAMVEIEGADLDVVYEKIDEVNEEWFKSIEDAGYPEIRDYYNTLDEILNSKK